MPDDPQPTNVHASRRVLLVVGVALVVLAVDQATKVWALAALADADRRQLLGDLLGLQLTRNAGAALSLGTQMTWVLTLVAVVVAVIVVRTARRTTSTAWAVTFGLLLGGAVGNLADRLLRSPGPGRGHVVDFIAYGDWFIGNVADIAIVVAAGLVMVFVAWGLRLDGTREDRRPARAKSLDEADDDG